MQRKFYRNKLLLDTLGNKKTFAAAGIASARELCVGRDFSCAGMVKIRTRNSSKQNMNYYFALFLYKVCMQLLIYSPTGLVDF